MVDPRWRNPSWVTHCLIQDNGAQPLWAARFRLPSPQAIDPAVTALVTAGALRVTRLGPTNVLVEFDPVRVRRIAAAAVAHSGLPLLGKGERTWELGDHSSGASRPTGGDVAESASRHCRTLPLARDALPGSTIRCMGAELLVVEGDDLLRDDYSAWLRDAGFPVIGVASGLEALELARTLRPEAIVMNLDLVGLDGWETARVVRRDATLRCTPILALTGHAAKTRPRDARAAGCDAVVPIPVVRDALLLAVRRLVRHA